MLKEMREDTRCKPRARDVKKDQVNLKKSIKKNL